MADFCEKCGKNLALVGRMHHCGVSGVISVTSVTPVTFTPVTACNACNTKDLLIAELRDQITALGMAKKLVVAGLEAGAKGETVKKSRAEYMAKRRAAKRASA
jgi:hypothetical protein